MNSCSTSSLTRPSLRMYSGLSRRQCWRAGGSRFLQPSHWSTVAQRIRETNVDRHYLRRRTDSGRKFAPLFTQACSAYRRIRFGLVSERTRQAGDAQAERLAIPAPGLFRGQYTYLNECKIACDVCLKRTQWLNRQAARNSIFSTAPRSSERLACQRSWLSCRASQLSGERPSAFDNRNAISGLTPLRPCRMRLRVDGDTPSFDAS